MAPRTRKRNPYPVPDISSEGFWVARGPALGKNVSANDRTWSSKVDVAERLFSHHTLNSIRRDQRIIRPNVIIFDELFYLQNLNNFNVLSIIFCLIFDAIFN